MFQVRIHGRGGQGVVTAAEMLALAAFDEGRYAQAFPSFGSERTGAPVVAFCRIDDKPIRVREPIVTPDALIIQDATLLHQVDCFGGLKPEGHILINTGKSLAELGLEEYLAAHPRERVLTLNATEIALRRLGRPLPNVPLLAGFAAMTGLIRLEAVEKAIAERFAGKVAAGNLAAAREAYSRILSSLERAHV
ncbi:MAG: 2-oxoacid:acceptor oxidoreductase family protein [Rhodocyclaceae bacterium]|nr:2-oxoacid:acceptor oxidoreductase family protein [Rhodocyclaceae bacterium]